MAASMAARKRGRTSDTVTGAASIDEVKRPRTDPFSIVPTVRTYLADLRREEEKLPIFDVPQLVTDKPINFIYSSEDRRCKPTNAPLAPHSSPLHEGGMEGKREGKRESKERKVVYDTLRNCKANSPAFNPDADNALTDDLERLIGGYVNIGGVGGVGGVGELADYSDSDWQNFKLVLPRMQEDLQQSQDVTQYYLDGNTDFVIHLLNAGYGTRNLANVLNHLFNKVTHDEMDHQLFSLIVRNPLWIKDLDAHIRQYTWIWGVVDLFSLVEGKQIDRQQFDRGVQLLTDNVYPLYLTDGYIDDSIGDIDILRSIGDDIPDHVIRTLLNKFIRLAESDAPVPPDAHIDGADVKMDPYHLKQVQDAIRAYYNKAVCSQIDYERKMDSRALTIIEDDPILSPVLKDLIEERKLQQLSNRLQDIYLTDEIINTLDGGETDESKASKVSLERDIRTLIGQGVGKCFWPRNNSLIRRLDNDIVRPFVKDFDQDFPNDSEGRVTFQEDRVMSLLNSSTPLDLRELILLLTSIDPTKPMSRSLLANINEDCDAYRGRLGCLTVAALVEQLLNPQPAA